MKIEDIGKEMAGQNNRVTQYPMFVVYHKVERSVGDDSGSSRRIQECDEELVCDDCTNKYQNDHEMPDYCPDCDPECFWNCDETLEPDLRAGVFFTAKACQAHIDANKYHYNEPVVYGIGSWRNEEMQLVQKHLIELAGKKIPSHYL